MKNAASSSVPWHYLKETKNENHINNHKSTRLTTIAFSTPAISGAPGAGGAGEKPRHEEKIDSKPKPHGIVGKGIKRVF